MAKTVPRAEPITPSFNCFMNIKLKIIFIMVVNIKKYNGVLLSPNALMKPNKRFENIIKINANPKIKIKLYESLNIV